MTLCTELKANITEEQRLDILSFLQWNDRNGCYLDRERIDVGYKIIRKREAIKQFAIVINEDYLIKNDIDIYNSTYAQIIKAIKVANMSFSTSIKLMLLFQRPEVKTYEKIIRL